MRHTLAEDTRTNEETTATPIREPRTHDYSTYRIPGHDISYRPGEGNTLTGHLFSQTRVEPGDFLILPNGARTTRYRVEKAKWCMDPDDMYFFDASFAPRENPTVA